MRMRRKHNLESRLLKCQDSGILKSFTPDNDFSYEYIYGGDVSDRIAFPASTFQLEIGCGKGGFILQKAQIEAENYFIAVESVGNVIVTACEKALAAGLKNVQFLRCNAKYLPRLFPKACVTKIYLNFSCPYPKKRQANLRLTSDEFLKVYDHLLSPEGYIALKTDKPEFFTYSLQQLSEYGFVLKNISLSLHDDEIGKDNIMTEYESKFAALGLPIYYLEAHRR